MFNKLDHLIVAVKNLEEAENNYQKLFGMAPVWSGTHKELGTSNSLFNFQNTYFELLAPTSEGLGADLVNFYLEQTLYQSKFVNFHPLINTFTITIETKRFIEFMIENNKKIHIFSSIEGRILKIYGK